MPATAREVADVPGAGDTVIATLALAIAAGASLVQAAALANRAAGIAVATTAAALPAAPTLSRVIFCCFSNEAALLHAQALADFGSPCAD